MTIVTAAQSKTPEASRRRLVYRHALATRLTHWINALCVTVLLMSGLQIFLAHPALYWGQFGADSDRPAFEIGAETNKDGAERGFVRLGSATLDTTGVLGLVPNADGDPTERAFPRWATIPSWRSLALGRRWHFFFAWLFVANLTAYYVFGLINGHLRRELAPTRDQLRPSAILADIGDHLRLKFPKGEAARRYNPLQKLAYVGVVAALLPLMILTGLTMSPGMDAALPWLVELFGGRQSARTIHFITAGLLLLFVLVHLTMVLLAGPINGVRAMITGKLAISEDDDHEPHSAR
ncbi:thiosulfate reductase cytochrome b subunit [Roseiarcus fermentans]|uniref:Thiosulfate reductase cytochrome b subunit n=1 Tax=Roseiarcus fermentans TaxID=1473586 RepID=A0A366FLL4_9HYPH|nr:cytochrome b/b6 domain-containing protein [Roseiarcus fermentans]RBP15552.1 thiosulfate reductase cytochrome b subunit [Roseiarcus fermentans]